MSPIASSDNKNDKHIYVYPTKEQLKAIRDEFPAVKSLLFDWNSINYKRNSFETIILDYNLFAWKQCLFNKLSKLRFSYCLVKFYKSLGIPDDNWQEVTEEGELITFPHFKPKHFQLLGLFNYHVDYFYFQFYSVWETLFQVYNIAFEFGIKDGIGFTNKVKNKLKKHAPNFLFLLETQRLLMDDAFKFRNDLTHNFPLNELDHRSVKEEIDGQQIISMGLPKYTPTSEILENVEQHIVILSTFLRKLENEFQKAPLNIKTNQRVNF